MALVPVEGPGIPGSSIMLEQLTEILFDIASSLGIYQTIKGEIKGHKAAKVNAELEQLARILMNDSARANEIIRAHSSGRDDIVQSLIGSSPVGSRIEKLREKYNRINDTIKAAEKRASENSDASDQLSSLQRSFDNQVAMYGKTRDQRIANDIAKKNIQTRDEAINAINELKPISQEAFVQI